MFKNSAARFQQYILKHEISCLVLLLFIAIAIALSIILPAAFTYYYNSDEAWYYYDSLAPSLWASIVKFHSNATHPILGIVRVYLAREWLDQFWFIRLTSVVFYLGCGAAAFMLGRTIHNVATGALLATILLLSPHMIEMSVSLRGYIMEVFWLLIGLVGYYRYVQTTRLRFLVLYSAAMLLATLTEYSAIIITFSYFLAHTYYLLGTRPTNFRKQLLYVALANGLVGLAFLGYYFSQHELLHGANPGWNKLAYFYEDHRIINFFEIVMLPSKILSWRYLFPLPVAFFILIAFYVYCWKNRSLYFGFGTQHVVIPTLITLILAYAADAFELYPFIAYEYMRRLQLFAVVVYSIWLAFTFSLLREKVYFSCRALFIPAVLGITILAALMGPSRLNEWSITNTDFNRTLAAIKQLPPESTLLMDDQGFLLLSSAGVLFESRDSWRFGTLGATKLVAPKGKVLGAHMFFLHASSLEEYFNTYTKGRAGPSLYFIKFDFGDGLCDEWKKDFTNIEFEQDRITIFKISPNATPASLDLCKTNS